MEETSIEKRSFSNGPAWWGLGEASVDTVVVKNVEKGGTRFMLS